MVKPAVGLTDYVEANDDIPHWSDISGPVEATGPISQYVQPAAPDITSGFFRIRKAD